MKTHTLDQLVNEHAFFAGMSEEVGEIVSGCARNEHFPEGQYLAREGAAADDFFLIRGGRVALEIFVPGKAALVVETLEAGDVLGWSWLVEPYQWMFDARAVTPVRAIALNGRCLRTKFEDHPALGCALYGRVVKVLANRLTGARLRLIDMFAGPGGEASGDA